MEGKKSTTGGKRKKAEALPQETQVEELTQEVSEIFEEEIIPQATADEQKLHASYKDEVLEEEKPRPTDAEIRAWRNDPPEPGMANVAVSPSGPNVTRRGFTTLHMANAARNQMANPEDYFVVELRDVQGAILAYYVTYKREEL